MNVDIFKSDQVKYYFASAIPMMVVVLAGWYLIKHVLAQTRQTPVNTPKTPQIGKTNRNHNPVSTGNLRTPVLRAGHRISTVMVQIWPKRSYKAPDKAGQVEMAPNHVLERVCKDVRILS